MLNVCEPVIEDLYGKGHHFNGLKENPNKDGQKVLFPSVRHGDEDVNRLARNISGYATDPDLDDHPGFTDPVYRERRKQLTDIALHHKIGQPIPRVEYTEAETATWSTVFKSLVKLYPGHACQQFNKGFSVLVEKGVFQENSIPQLQDVSDFLKDCTNFELRPVAGFIPFREFLAGLAFRVFSATQYIRHGSRPMFTPEPDMCHELLGHIAFLVDPEFAQLMQEIGLASLGASEDDMKKLASLLWFTVEFGICHQEIGGLKAYGAGVLSSSGEILHCFSGGQPEFRPLDIEEILVQKYPITSFQPVYFVANSFEDVAAVLRRFVASLPRPFSARYNSHTQTVEVTNSKKQVINLTKDFKGDVSWILDGFNEVNN